jgi:hypothetical protein
MESVLSSVKMHKQRIVCLCIFLCLHSKLPNSQTKTNQQ